MDACIVLGVTFIALTYVLSSSPTFAQQISQTSVPPAPTHKSVTIVIGNKFQGVLNASTTALRIFVLATTILITTVAGCLSAAAKRPKKAAILFHPARNISATRRLCHPTRSRQPARRVQTFSMSNINKKSGSLNIWNGAPRFVFLRKSCEKFVDPP